MMLVLQRCHLWDVICGAETCPSAILCPGDYRAWVNKDQEALLQIVMTLKEGPHNSILDVKTLKECWDILAKRYQAKGNQGAVALMEKLFMTPFSDMEPIQGQIDQYRLTLCGLEAVSFTLAEKWAASLLIIKLPSCYSMLKMMISTLPESQITLNDIIDQVLTDEACHI